MRVAVRFALLLAVTHAGLTACAQTSSPHAASKKVGVSRGPFTEEERQQFVALDVIDTHTHIFHPSPVFRELVQRLNLRMIDIVVMDDHGKHPQTLAQRRDNAESVIAEDKDRMALCTTFDPYKFNSPGFTEAAIRELDADFDRGAVAVKIWKNVGMEIKDAKGRYVLPDDPSLEPIYADIAAHNKTLIAHLADPNTLWAPPNPKADDYSYYMFEEPWWYMYHRAGAPSKESILKARDHILEQNPKLRVVGAHMGSLEADFADLGAHLDRYPNFAVDLAGRVPYLEMMPRDEAIAFITRYQDRLIYATDNDFEFVPASRARSASREWETAYANQWRYLATTDTVLYQGKPVKGLALPPAILKKLYHDNALRWFPGAF